MIQAITARQLDARAVLQYKEDGFLIVRSLFSDGEISALGAEAERLYGLSHLIDTDNIRCRWQNHFQTGECRFDCFDPVIDLSPAYERVARSPQLLDLVGQLYEERGRGFLAMRGQMTYLQPGKKRIVANLRSGDELKALIKTNDWNQVHIIARGNVLTHIFNGHLMAQAVDDDPTGRAMGGLIGFQMHVGPPMKLELRNIWLKNM